MLHDEKGELIGPVIRKGFAGQRHAGVSATSPKATLRYRAVSAYTGGTGGQSRPYKRLNVVTGDAKAGEAYFNGAGGCKGCHSVTGDLAHVGTKYQPERLQNSASCGRRGGGERDRAEGDCHAAFGTSVPGTVKQMDDFNVSMFDAAGNYRSWPRERIKVELDDRLAGHRQLLEKYTDADMHNLTAYLVTLK